MGRKRKIDVNVVIGLIDRYHYEFPEAKVKIPEIGNYIRKNGIDVDDYLLRRYDVITKHINDINSQSEEVFTSVIITYKPVDPENFFYTNRSKEKMINTITELNSYYSYICSAALHFKKEKENTYQYNKKLKAENDRLKKENEILKTKVKNARKKDQIIKKLKDIISEDVYPEKAASLLKEKGIFEIEDSIIDPSSNANIITSETDIQKFTSDILNELVEDLDK